MKDITPFKPEKKTRVKIEYLDQLPAHIRDRYLNNMDDNPLRVSIDLGGDFAWVDTQEGEDFWRKELHKLM